MHTPRSRQGTPAASQITPGRHGASTDGVRSHCLPRRWRGPETPIGDVETDRHNRLHVWLLRIVGTSTAHTSMALMCRWRSRPQHQKRTLGGAIRKIKAGLLETFQSGAE